MTMLGLSTTFVPITATDLEEGDVVTFSYGGNGRQYRVMELEKGAAWVTLRWMGQGGRCGFPTDTRLYRVSNG